MVEEGGEKNVTAVTTGAANTTSAANATEDVDANYTGFFSGDVRAVPVSSRAEFRAEAGGLLVQGATGGWEVVVDGKWQAQDQVTVSELLHEEEVTYEVLRIAAEETVHGRRILKKARKLGVNDTVTNNYHNFSTLATKLAENKSITGLTGAALASVAGAAHAELLRLAYMSDPAHRVSQLRTGFAFSNLMLPEALTQGSADTTERLNTYLQRGNQVLRLLRKFEHRGDLRVVRVGAVGACAPTMQRGACAVARALCAKICNT